MDNKKLSHLLETLIHLPKETEWVEFKLNNKTPDEIGEYISTLSNGACLHDEKHGYLIFGVEDTTHEVKGTSFRPKFEKIGNEELENWLLVHLDPRIDFAIHEFDYKGFPVVIFVIDATTHKPVSFKNVEYIRVGSYKKKLSEHTEKARKIWNKSSKITFENSIALKNVSDDDVIKLLDYPSYFDLMKLNLPSNKQ